MLFDRTNYDVVCCVYPDALHGTYDQTELDTYDVDKRFNILYDAGQSFPYTITGTILINIIGSWTAPDTTPSSFYKAYGTYSTASDVDVQVIGDARWDSVWNPNYYQLETTGYCFSFGSYAAATRFRMDGIVCKPSGTVIMANNDKQYELIQFTNCIFYGPGIGTNAYGFYSRENSWQNLIYENCIFTDFYGIGYANYVVDGAFRNCTFNNCGFTNAPNMTVNNCVNYNGSSLNCKTGSDYNATSLGTAIGGSNSIINITDPFIDSANLDFRIAETSVLVQAGAILAEITTDIVGVSRPQGQYHDIGAFEYDSGGQTGVPVNITLSNLVIGSRITVEKTDGTVIVSPTEVTETTVVFSFAYIVDTSIVVKVRLSSAGNLIRYKPYRANNVISSAGVTVYVDQQEDEVLN